MAGALSVHVVIIALLILVGFTLPEQSEEGGVPVMIGEVPDASGAASPSLVEVDVLPEEAAPEMPEEVEQDFRLFVVLHGGKILNKNADLRGNGKSAQIKKHK